MWQKIFYFFIGLTENRIFFPPLIQKKPKLGDGETYEGYTEIHMGVRETNRVRWRKAGERNVKHRLLRGVMYKYKFIKRRYCTEYEDQ